jgi:hypothetical protein
LALAGREQQVLRYEAEAVSAEPVGSPAGVRLAGAEGGRQALEWDAVPGAVSYNVYQDTQPQCRLSPANLLCVASEPRLLLPGAGNDRRYYYAVTAESLGGLESAAAAGPGTSDVVVV